MANIIRGTKFSFISLFSFGIEEFVLWAGLVLAGMRYLILTAAVSVVVSVAAGFLLNEWWTVRKEGEHGGALKGLMIRLAKFEIVYALGSAVGIVVMLLIVWAFGINPVIANLGGAIAAYPLNYVISMLYVWRIRIWVE